MFCLSLFLSNKLSLYLVHRPINIEAGSDDKVIILVLIFSLDCCLGQWGLGEPRPHPPPAQQV